jgi:hypothetical protein
MVNASEVVLGGEEITLLDQGSQKRIIVTLAEHEDGWYYGLNVNYHNGGFSFAPSTKWHDGFETRNKALGEAKKFILERIANITKNDPREKSYNQAIIAACGPEQRSLFPGVVK